MLFRSHPVVARGLSELLKGHPLLQSTVMTQCAPECTAYLQDHGLPVVAIVDFWLHGQASRQLVIALKTLHIPVLMISADEDPLVKPNAKNGARMALSASSRAPVWCARRSLA